MGVVVKKHLDSVKYHIIHDLSWPPRDSVNDHINPHLYCCVYASFNQAVSHIKKHGVGTLMAKLDLANAFKHILVHPEEWPLLCNSWDASLLDGSVCRQYYINLFLPFDLHSSPAIFNQYTNIRVCHVGEWHQRSAPLPGHLLHGRPCWLRQLPAQHNHHGKGLQGDGVCG